MDCLPSDAVRECFLYIALFPNVHWVSEQELIEHWIGEGLLPKAGACNISISGTDHVTHAVKRGQDVIEMLKSANLLVGLSESRGWAELYKCTTPCAKWLCVPIKSSWFNQASH